MMQKTEWQNPQRLTAPDALRGLIMILMALDHANHFVAQKHSPGEYWGGPFPAYAEVLAFLTRFVTHLAAPGFFFLMGIGMYLFAQSRKKRGWGKARVIGHFWLRGLILIALQMLVINRAWELSPQGWQVDIYIGVLFALGGTMMLGSLMLWLPSRVLWILVGVLFVGTEFLVPEMSLWNRIGFSNPMDYLNPVLIRPGGTGEFWSNYPILPWLELVVFGILFGNWLRNDMQKAYRQGLILGGVFLVAFGLLRMLNGFGNIRPMSGKGWIAFLNVVKYPPSMTFTLLTMGINLILLWGFSRVKETHSKYLQPLIGFGREPLFFYILHLFLYAGLGYLLTPEGSSLLIMYPIWILGLLILYPLCIGYGRLKLRPGFDKVLRYF